MANKKLLFGVLAITLVFGLMVTACDPEADPALNGTWKRTQSDGSYETFTITSGTIEYTNRTFNYNDYQWSGIANWYTAKYQGTYVTSGGVVVATITKRDPAGTGTLTTIPTLQQTTTTLAYSVKNGKLYLTGSFMGSTMSRAPFIKQ